MLGMERKARKKKGRMKEGTRCLGGKETEMDGGKRKDSVTNDKYVQNAYVSAQRSASRYCNYSVTPILQGNLFSNNYVWS
jgi:hypothetical protein